MGTETTTTGQTRFRTFLLISLLLGVCSVCALRIDIPVARAFRDDVLPGDLRAIFSLAEVFAHAFGVLAILLIVWVVAVEYRRKILRVACCAFVPGVTASLCKVLIGRHRPNSLGEISESVWLTFDGIFPAIAQANLDLLFERDLQSLPSGHSATAVGLAIGLSWLFPRGKWCFAAFAALAMCQRLESGAHFPSDTLVAGALATLIAGRYLTLGWECRFFTRFENPQTGIKDTDLKIAA